MGVSSGSILQGGTVFSQGSFPSLVPHQGGITAGDFALDYGYKRLIPPARSYGDVMRSFAITEQVISFLRIPNQGEGPPEAKSLPPSAPADTLVLEFDHASLSHTRGSWLKNVAFKINPGKCVAVIGLSGASKSTLVRLLLRMHAVQDGRFRVNDVVLKSVNQTSIRLRVALVPQDSVLFISTVRVSVLYARLDASDMEIWAAVTAASLEALVRCMLVGLDTNLG